MEDVGDDRVITLLLWLQASDLTLSAGSWKWLFLGAVSVVVSVGAIAIRRAFAWAERMEAAINKTNNSAQAILSFAQLMRPDLFKPE